MQLITDTSFGAAGLMGRVDAPPRTPEWTLVDWPQAIISVPPTALRMAFPSVVHPGRPGGRRALSAPAEPRPPNIGTGFDRGSHWSRDLILTLYFSEVNAEMHGPMHVARDEQVEHIQAWLEEKTFRSRCFDEETNERLAHVEISTSSGRVLDQCRNLYNYPVSDGDTLTVILVPADDLSVLEAEVRESA